MLSLIAVTLGLVALPTLAKLFVLWRSRRREKLSPDERRREEESDDEMRIW